MNAPPAHRLLAALLAPTVLGAVGLWGAGSLPLAFWLYAAGGCLAVPWPSRTSTQASEV